MSAKWLPLCLSPKFITAKYKQQRNVWIFVCVKTMNLLRYATSDEIKRTLDHHHALLADPKDAYKNTKALSIFFSQESFMVKFCKSTNWLHSWNKTLVYRGGQHSILKGPF